MTACPDSAVYTLCHEKTTFDAVHLSVVSRVRATSSSLISISVMPYPIGPDFR